MKNENTRSDGRETKHVFNINDDYLRSLEKASNCCGEMEDGKL